MRVISNKTFDFLVGCFEDAVQNFLDDPDGMFGGEDVGAMALHYYDLLVVARDCEKKFWDVAVAQGTSYEIERLLSYLKQANVEDLPIFADLPEGRNGF